MKSVLVRGIGDIGSTVARLLHVEGHAVVIHDVPSPPWTHRKMALTDALFDGEALLDGVGATGIDHLPALRGRARPTAIAVSVHVFDMLVQTLPPDILIDARMRKRRIPERQIDLTKCTIDLGSNFFARGTRPTSGHRDCRGEALGAVIGASSGSPPESAPRAVGGFGIDRAVYAPAQGYSPATLPSATTWPRGRLSRMQGCDRWPHPLAAESVAGRAEACR